MSEAVKKIHLINLENIQFSDIENFSTSSNVELIPKSEETNNNNCVLKSNDPKNIENPGSNNYLMLSIDFFKDNKLNKYIEMLLKGEFHNDYKQLFNLDEFTFKELRVVNLKRIGHYTDLLIEDFKTSKIIRDWRTEITHFFELITIWKNDKKIGIPLEINYFVKDDFIFLQCATHYHSNELTNIDLLKMGDFNSLIFLNNPKHIFWNLFWYKENYKDSSLGYFSNMKLQKDNFIFRENDTYAWAYKNELPIETNDNSEVLNYNNLKKQTIKEKSTESTDATIVTDDITNKNEQGKLHLIKGDAQTEPETKTVINNTTQHFQEKNILVKSSNAFKDGLGILTKIQPLKQLSEEEYARMKYAHLLGLKAVSELETWATNLNANANFNSNPNTNEPAVISSGVDQNPSNTHELATLTNEKRALERQVKVISDKYNELVAQLQDKISDEVKKIEHQITFYKNENGRLNSELALLKPERIRLEKEVRELQLIVRKKEMDEQAADGNKNSSDSKKTKTDMEKKSGDDSKDTSSKNVDAKFKLKITVLEKNLVKLEEEKIRATDDLTAAKATMSKMKSENTALHNEIEKLNNKIKVIERKLKSA